MNRVMVTGGAGFIGSAVVRSLAGRGVHVLNVDKLTYAGTLMSVAEAAGKPGYEFAHADICDETLVSGLLARFQPDAVLHLAAESHVDRSIAAPRAFVDTNLVGTFSLLRAALDYRDRLAAPKRDAFRLLHVSTDEVYGSLGAEGKFSATSPYRPNSPYAASKAGADHLVRAWHHTYGLPAIITNCTNNYGPYQFPEKLIPLLIVNGLAGKPMPIYGRGENVRDWLHVEDHVDALLTILEKGLPGRTYAIAGQDERRNIDVARGICALLDELAPDAAGLPRDRLITQVADRPGHDFRYALDDTPTREEIGWRPKHDFAGGLRLTVQWYLANRSWWEPLVSRSGAGALAGTAGNSR